MTKHKRSIGRRRTRSLVGFAAKNLCETIPKSLTPSERLLMLFERSYQYALSIVQKECMEMEDFDISSFRKYGTTCWEKIKSDIEENNLCQLAVTEQTLTNQTLLGGMIMEKEKAIIEAESNKWNEQVYIYRRALEKEVEFEGHSVSTSQRKERDELYDYSNIIQYTSSTHEKLKKQIDTLSTCETAVKRSLMQSKVYNKNLQRQCEKHFLHKVSQTPRTLMKKMASANTR